MIDNNMQYNGQKRRKQKRRSYQFFIPALFVVMMIARYSIFFSARVIPEKALLSIQLTVNQV